MAWGGVNASDFVDERGGAHQGYTKLTWTDARVPARGSWYRRRHSGGDSMDELRGRVAVVTGGGNGIGRGIAGALAEAGASVVVADLETDAAEAAAAELAEAGHKAIARRVDVTDADDLAALADATVEAFGAVHVLANNAGVMTVGPLAEATEDDWSWIFDVNVHGVVRGVRAFLPHLRASAPAHIVNTVSMAAVAPRLSGEMGIYTAAKAAVFAYSEVLRAELANDGIGVTALCPGPVRTRIWEAERNRPARFGEPKALEAPARTESQDPAEVGRMVVDAIRRDAAYLFTNLGSRERIEEREAGIREALDFLGRAST